MTKIKAAVNLHESALHEQGSNSSMWEIRYYIVYTSKFTICGREPHIIMYTIY